MTHESPGNQLSGMVCRFCRDMNQRPNCRDKTTCLGFLSFMISQDVKFSQLKGELGAKLLKDSGFHGSFTKVKTINV